MTDAWIDYDYALIRLVPCVHRGAALNVGVVLHAPTEGYLGARFLDELSSFEPLAPTLDWARVLRYLAGLAAVADGAEGPLAALSTSERFHWLTAPRSDVLQPSATHPGRTRSLEVALDRLFEREVLPAGDVPL